MASRPNLLLIMSDQHSPDVLGAAGHPHVRTPHLDRLAQRGVHFTRGYCNSPICLPSRQSFLTGRLPNEIGVWSLSDTIRSDEVTWPALLGAAGYETAIAGRMHFWWPDKLHGFQRRLSRGEADHISQVTWEMYEAGPRRDVHLKQLREQFLAEFTQGTGAGVHPSVGTDEEATAAAVRYLREEVPQRPDLPFALCVGYYCPHSPLRFSAKYFDRYRDLPVDVEVPDADLPPAVQTFVRNCGFTEPMPAETYRNAVRAYFAMVDFIDDQVGAVLNALAESGQLDNTVVVYTSDHGEMLGRRGLWYKNQLLEPAIRTPLLVAGPGVAGGRAVDVPVSLLDLFPTIAQLADAPKWEPISGDSLWPLLGGEGDLAPWRARPVLCEYADFGISQPAACVLLDHWKLLAARTYDPVLYDLASDPGERCNRANDPACAGMLGRLQAALAARWDADDVYQRVIQRQKAVDIHRQSRAHLRARQQHGGAV